VSEWGDSYISLIAIIFTTHDKLHFPHALSLCQFSVEHYSERSQMQNPLLIRVMRTIKFFVLMHYTDSHASAVLLSTFRKKRFPSLAAVSAGTPSTNPLLHTPNHVFTECAHYWRRKCISIRSRNCNDDWNICNCRLTLSFVNTANNNDWYRVGAIIKAVEKFRVYSCRMSHHYMLYFTNWFLYIKQS
jgi:hypothetical protein